MFPLLHVVMHGTEIQILHSHSPRSIWRCAGDFVRVLLKFKMAPTSRFLDICVRKKSKPNLWRGMLQDFRPLVKIFFRRGGGGGEMELKTLI